VQSHRRPALRLQSRHRRVRPGRRRRSHAHGAAGHQALGHQAGAPASGARQQEAGFLMFRVDVDSLQAYLAFDPKRKRDLLKLHAAISKAAPGLKRHFHAGTPEGHAGMRFKMIGYGRYHYTAGTGEKVAWPVIGVALQKNYISVYVSVTKNGKSIVG